jgi:hypothetical protein
VSDLSSSSGYSSLNFFSKRQPEAAIEAAIETAIEAAKSRRKTKDGGRMREKRVRVHHRGDRQFPQPCDVFVGFPVDLKRTRRKTVSSEQKGK